MFKRTGSDEMNTAEHMFNGALNTNSYFNDTAATSVCLCCDKLTFWFVQRLETCYTVNNQRSFLFNYLCYYCILLYLDTIPPGVFKDTWKSDFSIQL